MEPSITKERSVGEILKNIALHVEEIVRCEIRLAGSEFKQEAKKAITPIRSLAIGGVVALLGVLYLLLGAVFGLSLLMPAWAAAALVGAILALVGAVLVSSAIEKWKRLDQPLERTIERLGDNATWLKNQVKS